MEYRKRAKQYVNGESFIYMGRNYSLQIVLDNKITLPEAKLSRGKFYVYTFTKDEEIVRHALENWYKDIEVFLGRKTKAPRKSNAKHIYPLTELLKCGLCGHYLGFTERTDRKGLLSVKKCWYTDFMGVKCSNQSSSMLALVEMVNQSIENYIKDIEQEDESIDARELEKMKSQ